MVSSAHFALPIQPFQLLVTIPNPSAIGTAGSPTLNLASSIVDGVGKEFHGFAIVAF
jgi:hypothetical protein